MGVAADGIFDDLETAFTRQLDLRSCVGDYGVFFGSGVLALACRGSLETAPRTPSTKIIRAK